MSSSSSLDFAQQKGQFVLEMQKIQSLVLAIELII
jgi:hypothetical protein